MHDEALPADPSSAQLHRELSSMAVPAPQSQIRSNAPIQSFTLENNMLGGSTRVL